MPRLWDDSLYAGSARYYQLGRLPYPQRLVSVLQQRLGLTGSGRALDLGCGPGALTLLLAPLVGEVVAVDADADMIRVARAAAEQARIDSVRWCTGAAEDIEVAGSFELVTLAQSLHWMDRPLVAARILDWLVPGGCCAHLGATTHKGQPAVPDLPHPSPPREQIRALVTRYLGSAQRAGQGLRFEESATPDKQAVLGAVGLAGPEVIEVAGGELFERTEEQVIASVLSLSSAAPHLFGAKLDSFLADLRVLLRSAAPAGRFSEVLQGMTWRLWFRPDLPR